jgi:hypothetical protein
MSYMINVDLESKNSRETGSCHSKSHESLGSHFDLTVHAVGCQIRGARAVDRPPTRYWDDNGGVGYSFAQATELARTLKVSQPEAHARRCLKCDVEGNLPDWD